MSIKPVDMQVVLQNVGRVENPHAGDKLASQQQQFTQAFQDQVQKQQDVVLKMGSSDTDGKINKDRRNKNEHHDGRKKRRQGEQGKQEGKEPPRTSSFDATI